jgi:hypothetical protein
LTNSLKGRLVGITNPSLTPWLFFKRRLLSHKRDQLPTPRLPTATPASSKG